jgi:hypothetical protein
MKTLSFPRIFRAAFAMLALAVGTPVGLGVTAGLVLGPTPAFSMDLAD